MLGARLALGFELAALGFLPLARTGIGALRTGGTAEQRLSAWIAGAHDAVRSALMALAGLRAWRARAEAGIADLSGRTPRLLIDALARQVMVALPQLVAETGASRAPWQFWRRAGSCAKSPARAGTGSGPRGRKGCGGGGVRGRLRALEADPLSAHNIGSDFGNGAVSVKRF